MMRFQVNGQNVYAKQSLVFGENSFFVLMIEFRNDFR